MEKKLISVITPCYNGEKFIKRCIDSILNQTYQNFEIIVINDGSTDNSLDILNEYTDERIKIISQENRGLGETRNVGIRHTTGDYITFLDADDWIEEYTIENYINTLKDGDYDIVIGGYKTFDGKRYKKVKIKDDIFNLYNHTEPRNRIYKRKFLKENNILYKDLRSNEDFEFCCQTYSKTSKIKIIDNSGYIYYIQNNKSITKTMHKKFFPDFQKALLYVTKIKVPNDHKIFKEYKEIKASIFYLLYSGRNERNTKFIQEYNSIFNILKKNIKINNYILITNKIRLKENPIHSIIIQGFLIIRNLKLIRIFAKIYCKG